MTPAFVVDASVAIAWMHPAQATGQTDQMLDALADGVILEVPALWSLEVAHALIVLERRRKLRSDERKQALGWLQGLRVRVDHDAASLAFTRVSELAMSHHLSAYDATYLELAQRRNLRLGCKDGPLRQAATDVGIELWA